MTPLASARLSIPTHWGKFTLLDLTWFICFVSQNAMTSVPATDRYGVQPLLISEGGFYKKEAKIDLLPFGLHTRTTPHQNPTSDGKLICHGSASTQGRV